MRQTKTPRLVCHRVPERRATAALPVSVPDRPRGIRQSGITDPEACVKAFPRLPPPRPGVGSPVGWSSARYIRVRHGSTSARWRRRRRRRPPAGWQAGGFRTSSRARSQTGAERASDARLQPWSDHLRNLRGRDPGADMKTSRASLAPRLARQPFPAVWHGCGASGYVRDLAVTTETDCSDSQRHSPGDGIRPPIEGRQRGSTMTGVQRGGVMATARQKEAARRNIAKARQAQAARARGANVPGAVRA